MNNRDEEIKECFLDMLNQSCAVWTSSIDHDGEYVESKFKGYDSMCLSAYERSLSLAVDLGWIKKEDVSR